jgi:hypothetical protein
MDIFSNPIIVAVVAILAIPAVTSGVTGLLRWVTEMTGVGPKVIVYAVSLILTGVLIATGGGGLPQAGDDPTAWVAAWIAWTTVNAELARRVYELLNERLETVD